LRGSVFSAAPYRAAPARCPLGRVPAQPSTECRDDAAVSFRVTELINQMTANVAFGCDRGLTRKLTGSPAIVNISFNPVKDFTPLQAADVIATENYWHAGGVIAGNEDPRPHFAHFLKQGHTNGYIMQEAEIFETLRRHGF
jgi:hypothetical protein